MANLPSDVPRMEFRHRIEARQILFRITALNKLHDQIELVLVYPKINRRNDIWVLELTNDLGLALKTFDGYFVFADKRLMNRLQRYRAIQRQLCRQKNNSSATFTN